MMRRLLTQLCLAAAALLVAATCALAQASSSLADLRGQVLDAAGAAIPNAKLTLTDVGKGTTRTATSDEEGGYIFLGLLPSTYDIRAEASGFAAKTVRVELTVGQQANIPVTLAAGNVTESVEILAGGEVVETDRTQQSSVIESNQIQNLPISRRNYLDYALLTPGVVDTDNIADASDFRVAQTPQSGLSFGGNNGRGNSVSLDGAETLTSSGGVRSSVSQEAVQEFQVLRNSFNAEFGGASGGVINIVSRTGTNNLHGSIFGLFRDDKFDARNPFDFNPRGQSPFSRQQYGGSLGGPLRRDKTFFFTALERFDQDETTFVNLLNDPNVFQPTATQTALFNLLANTPFAAVATGLRGALTTTAAAYPRTVNLFNSATGQFPFESYQTTYSARLDHNFTDRSNGYLRVNFNDSVFENQAAGALTAVSRGRTLDTFNGDILASHNYQFSDTFLNEFKAQFSYLRFGVIPNDQIGPELNIEGFGNFGRDIFLPSETIERHYVIYDNLSKVLGSHTVKFGFHTNLINVASDSQTFFGGRFNFGAAIPLSNIIALNPALGTPVLTQLNTALRACATATPAPAYCGATGAALGRDVIGGPVVRDASGRPVNSPNNIADALDAPINALQSFNLGLPIIYQQGFGSSVVKSWTLRQSFYAQDTWKAAQNFTLNYGLRYYVSEEPFYLPTYHKDLQPRVGFSWDPFRKGKTAIRGGAGIFVGPINNAVGNVIQTLGGYGLEPGDIDIVLATATSGSFGLPTSFAVYQTALALTNGFTRPITAADVRAAPPPTSGVLPGLTAQRITPRPGAPLEVRFRHDLNYRSPTTYQASLGVQQDLGGNFSVEASYLFTRGLYLTRNRDINPFRQTGPGSPLNPEGGPSFIRVAAGAGGLVTDFRNFLRLQDNIYESSANSFYHAGTLAVTRRFSNHFSLNMHYTLSKAIDEVTDFNSDFSAQNPLNLRLDRALSAFDQRHRAVFSGVFASPAENPILRDWQLAPIFIAGSGRPFNLLLGFDANNDGRSQSDRPGQAGRNTGRGEPFYSFDLRLARRFFVRESRFLELTFEGFNLFNRTNLTGINNIVGTCFAPEALRDAQRCQGVDASNFNQRGLRTKAPTLPLGFTAAADARKLQFGARFNF
jgi:hypothetical protein